MSRGFVKEGDQEEPVIIPQRAPLPSGVINYVTQNGYDELIFEKEKLLSEFSEIPKDNDIEHRRKQTLINGKIALLEERVSSARIINPDNQPKNEVRFGANVKILNNGVPMNFQIVGVDEADISKNKIAFTAPIARAVMGKKINNIFDFRLGNEIRKLKIIKIEY